MTDQTRDPADLPYIPIILDEDTSNGRSMAVLLDPDGFPAWTATSDSEVDKLCAAVEQINRARTAAGLDPIVPLTEDVIAVQRADAASLPAGKAALLPQLEEMIRSGRVTVWAFDAKEPGALDAMLGKVPGVFRDNSGQTGVTYQVDVESAAALAGDGPELDDASRSAAGEDYATRGERIDWAAIDPTDWWAGETGGGKTEFVIGEYTDGSPITMTTGGKTDATAQILPGVHQDRDPRRPGKTNLIGPAVRAAVDAKLIAARDTLLRRLPEGPTHDAIANGDLGAEATRAALLAVDADDPDVMVAAGALNWAIGYVIAGDIPNALTWIERVEQSFVDGNGDVNADIADTIPLTWVDSEDHIHTGNVGRLANAIEDAGLGGPDVLHVYAVKDHELVKVTTTVTGGADFDADSYATAVLTVELPDGSRLQDSWRVDGRG